MELPKIEGLLQRTIRHAAERKWFLGVCAALAFVGTASAAYPVTAVVVPAALLIPRRWRQIAMTTALSSAIGATLLVFVFHHLGWSQLYENFPALGTHASWQRVMSWAADYGAVALFFIAMSPLPQTPALIFFGIAHHDYASVFAAMLAGKLLKYALFAWAASNFPERFANGMAGLLRRKRGNAGLWNTDEK